MKKFATAIALTLCCVGFQGYADEVETTDIVTETEVTIEVEPCTSDAAEAPQQSAETDKGSN